MCKKASQWIWNLAGKYTNWHILTEKTFASDCAKLSREVLNEKTASY